MQLHGSAPPTQQLKDSPIPTQQLSKFSIAMFVKLERMLDQSLDLNLMLTSLLSKIIVLLPDHLEGSVVKGNHTNHEKPIPLSNPNLYNILNKVCHCLFIISIVLGGLISKQVCLVGLWLVQFSDPLNIIQLFINFSH